MKSDDDALQQAEEMDEVQRQARQGKLKKDIQSIEKSDKRADNYLDSLKGNISDIEFDN